MEISSRTICICLLVLFYCCFNQAKAKQIFDAQTDAQNLRDAITSNTIDTIVDILPARTLAARLDIANEYRKQFNEHLVQDLSNVLSGDLLNLINAMMKPRPEYYADELFRAMDGLGTDESILIEILCTLTNGEIKEVRRAYHQVYGSYLEEVIIKETSGPFLDLLTDLTRTERDEHMPPDSASAKTDANTLYSATQDDRWSIFREVLIHRSYGQLELVFQEFEKLAGQEIEASIQTNFSGAVMNGLLAIVASVKNKPKFYASKVYDAIAGLGTNELELDRLIVTRAEMDIEDVKREYAQEYDEDMAYAINNDTSGEYGRCLQILMRA